MSRKSIEELRKEKQVQVDEALDEQTRIMAKRISKMNKRAPWLKRINLQWKLILAFVCVTAIATVAGWLSINYIGRVADQYDVAIKSYGFAQGDVGHAMIMASESRRVVRDMVYFDDEERAAGYETEFAKLKEYYEIYEALVKENLVGEVEENAFATAHQKYDTYIAMASDIMAQAAHASARQREQLMTIVGTDLEAAFNECYTAYETLMACKTGDGEAEIGEIARINNLTHIILIIVIVIAFGASIAMGSGIAIYVARPLRKLVDVSEQMVEGNLDVKLGVSEELEDEVGQLAKAFSKMKNNLKEIIGDIDYQLDTMAKGDFRVASRCEESYVGDYQNILIATRNIANNLSDTLGQINRAAEEVGSGADQVSIGAQALSGGAAAQASSVEELSATIVELTQQINENAEHAENANELAQKAGAGIAESNQYMQEMIAAMRDITHKADEIGKIIKTIDDIAFQTNILALNAAVEAARAGSAGRGFAVVADEVRNLAQKSATAAKDTTLLIEGTVEAVANGTRIADKTAESLAVVVVQTNRVSEMMGDITVACENQASATRQISDGIEQVSNVVQTNSATSEESAAASQELAGQANLMKGMVEQFKLRESGAGVSAKFGASAYQGQVYSNQASFVRSGDKY